MADAGASYGLWVLVFINSAVFIIFAFSFFKPQTKRDWRSFGAFSAFVLALFTEMYGFPLTIFFLSGWLQSTWPEIDWFAHDSGHLPEMMFGWQSNPHFGPFHLLSFVFIGGGFWLISVAWHHLWNAQRQGLLATTGPYARIRHPQYVGFVLIMLGFLVQWPTLLTLGDVPGAGLDVRTAGPRRGGGQSCPFWRKLGQVCQPGSGFHTKRQHSAEC